MKNTKRTATPKPRLAAAPGPEVVPVKQPEPEWQSWAFKEKLAILETVQEKLGLHKCSLKQLAAAALALERDRGCVTPAENFINSILLFYESSERGERRCALTPEDVEEALEEFRTDYKQIFLESAAFVDRYAAEYEKCGGYEAAALTW